jgi:hypothetical protein
MQSNGEQSKALESSAVDEQTAIATTLIPETSSNSTPPLDSPSGVQSNGEHSNVLEQFTVFQKLPIELRLRIWKFTVEVTCYDTDSESNVPEPYVLPVVLHVCEESRREALRHHTLSFGSHSLHHIWLSSSTHDI